MASVKSDDIFSAKLMDLANLSEKIKAPKFSMFLDERQIYQAQRLLSVSTRERALFFGG